MILTGAGQIGMAIARRMCAQGLLNATYIPLLNFLIQHKCFQP